MNDRTKITLPLLIQQQSSATDEQQVTERGRAGMTHTVVNLAKTCAGTGCLALPYACQNGGSVMFVLGLVAVAAWNVYGVNRLVNCLKLIQHHNGGADEETESTEQRQLTRRVAQQPPQPPPSTASTLGKVAWVACGGPRGLLVMDLMVVILLWGIVISYLSAVISFLSDTPFTGGPFWDAIVVALLMALLAMVPDLGYLSSASALGLAVLCATFLVIAGYGIVAKEADPTTTSLPLWPSSLASASRCFGICVFGYGVVPLTYNFQDSMREPHRVVEATWIALALVAAGYCIVGVGILALFSGNECPRRNFARIAQHGYFAHCHTHCHGVGVYRDSATYHCTLGRIVGRKIQTCRATPKVPKMDGSWERVFCWSHCGSVTSHLCSSTVVCGMFLCWIG
jgi:hypothetical protein